MMAAAGSWALGTHKTPPVHKLDVHYSARREPHEEGGLGCMQGTPDSRWTHEA